MRQEVEESELNQHSGTDGETKVPKSCQQTLVQLTARPGIIIPFFTS